ncbi:MAG: 3'-5' exonuclease [Bacteroidetes bacterium]|nr:MAG: 3'-5' exonuclease [Bacteroidota bacterium]
MLEKINLEKMLFLDIETVPGTYHYEELNEELKLLFETKNRFRYKSLKQETPERDDSDAWKEVYGQMGGVQAEFGKIVCISVGFVRESRTGLELRIKSFYHHDEETLLKQFVHLLEEYYNSPYHLLCGHNAKEFDFPYICRRLLINGLKLPGILDIAGKKPWEINHLDTMELWKFGDFKAYTSLALLCHVFGIPTPKDDISGADVARVYYEEEGLERIKTYCEKDVVALVQLFLKMRGSALIDESAIKFS